MNVLGKLIAGALLVVGMNAAQSATAGVAVPPRVQVTCVDNFGVTATITQYNQQTVSVSLSNNTYLNGSGFLDAYGRGTVSVGQKGAMWTLYYSGSQLVIQFVQPGYAVAYGLCQLAR